MKSNLLPQTWLRLAARRVGLPLLALLAALAPLHADTLVLRDGRQITGVIDQNVSDAEQVMIRTNAGTLQIPRGNILSIKQEKGIGYTESSGDLAMAENKLERARDLYQTALEADPNNARIKQKIKQTNEQIAKRDQAFYSSAFSQIRQAIDAGQFEDAIKAGEDLRAKLQDENARKQARMLISEAHIGLARKSRDTINFADAESNYKQAALVDPQNPVPQLELAKMLEDSPTRKGEAIHLYEQGIALSNQAADRVDPAKLTAARYEMGKLYRDDHAYAKAGDTLLEVMRADKNQQYPQAVDLAIDSFANVPVSTLDEAGQQHIIAALRTIIQLKPTEARAALLLGRIYFDQHQWAEARDNMTAAVQNSAVGQQTHQDAYYYLGLAEHKLGDLNAAAAAFQALIDANTATYDSICELAEIKLVQADYNQAVTLFQRALEIDKEKYRAYLGLGEAQQKLGQFKDARANFQVVVTKDPSNAPAQLDIAESYFDEQTWDNAADEGDKAIKILIGDEKSSRSQAVVAGTSTSLLVAHAYTLIGNANLNLQKTNLARENFESSLKHETHFAAALDGIGRTYQADGLQKDAEVYFNRAIAADPKIPDSYLSMGIHFQKYLKSTDKALPYYMKYVELGGKDPNVRNWIKECGGTPPA